jgi:hypothetical protein
MKVDQLIVFIMFRLLPLLICLWLFAQCAQANVISLGAYSDGCRHALLTVQLETQDHKVIKIKDAESVLDFCDHLTKQMELIHKKEAQ